jgi:hypothetical protein
VTRRPYNLLWLGYVYAHMLLILFMNAICVQVCVCVCVFFFFFFFFFVCLFVCLFVFCFFFGFQCGFVWTVVLSGGPVGMWEARREGRRGGIAILGAALIVYGWVFLLDIMLLVGVRRGKYCLATSDDCKGLVCA